MILLDTHALIWLTERHRRSRPLERFPRLYVSPISVLELQFLVEVGRLRLKDGLSLDSLLDDDRWHVDEPPAARWCTIACEFGWTRDPFDRLLAAHARLRNWKLATADEMLMEQLPPSEIVRL